MSTRVTRAGDSERQQKLISTCEDAMRASFCCLEFCEGEAIEDDENKLYKGKTRKKVRIDNSCCHRQKSAAVRGAIASAIYSHCNQM